MPTSQQTSLTWRPPSTSFSTLMICVSVNRDFFMAFSVNGSLRRRTLVLHEATEGDAYNTSWPPPAHAPNQVGVIVDAAALSRPTTVLGIEGTPQEFGVAVGSLDSGSRFIDVDLYVDFRVTEKNKSAWPDLGAPGTSASNSFEDSPPFLLPPSMSPLRRVAPCPD